jgi:broad-specificity NMP kinase
VIVLRCDPEVLKKRLKARGYKAAKVQENCEAEALDYCTQRAATGFKMVFDLDTTNRTPKQTFEQALKIIYGTAQEDKVDFSHYLGKGIKKAKRAKFKKRGADKAKDKKKAKPKMKQASYRK